MPDTPTEYMQKLDREAYKLGLIKEPVEYDTATLNDLGIPSNYIQKLGGWSADNILKSVYQQTFSSERKKVDKIIDGYFNGIVLATDEHIQDKISESNEE